MTNSEIIMNVSMIIAVLVGPIAAVQITRYFEDRRLSKKFKSDIFVTLMTTRGSLLSQRHIDSLNSIDVAFSSNNQKDIIVRTNWIAYLDHLNNGNINDSWIEKRGELLIELLYSMGSSLGYDYNKTHLKNSVYAPKGHFDFENEQTRIRSAVLDVLTGQKAIAVDLKDATLTTTTKDLPDTEATKR